MAYSDSLPGIPTPPVPPTAPVPDGGPRPVERHGRSPPLPDLGVTLGGVVGVVTAACAGAGRISIRICVIGGAAAVSVCSFHWFGCLTIVLRSIWPVSLVGNVFWRRIPRWYETCSLFFALLDLRCLEK